MVHKKRDRVPSVGGNVREAYKRENIEQYIWRGMGGAEEDKDLDKHGIVQV